MTAADARIELRADGVVATIDPARGGRLASLVVEGRELLVTADDEIDSSIRWGCYLMAPWPGRLRGGRLTWDGRQYQLARTHGQHAIHGVTWSQPWSVERQTGTAAELRCSLAHGGWPLGGSAWERFTLAPGALTLEASVIAAAEMPAAMGWHPWFLRSGGEPSLTVQSAEVLETLGMIPTGRRLKAAGRLDLRSGPPLGSRRLDHTYVDVRSPVVMAWPDLRLEVAFEPPFSSLVVYTPATAVCVEPQTAWPDALGDHLAGRAEAGRRVIRPGDALRTTMRLRWS